MASPSPRTLLPGFQVAGSPLAPAEYDYDAKLRIAPTGLSPASTAASLAEPLLPDFHRLHWHQLAWRTVISPFSATDPNLQHRSCPGGVSGAETLPNRCFFNVCRSLLTLQGFASGSFMPQFPMYGGKRRMGCHHSNRHGLGSGQQTGSPFSGRFPAESRALGQARLLRLGPAPAEQAKSERFVWVGRGEAHDFPIRQDVIRWVKCKFRIVQDSCHGCCRQEFGQM